MSALAIPATRRPVRGHVGHPPARGHLELVVPGFVPQHPGAGPTERAAAQVQRPGVRLTARGRMVRACALMVLALAASVGAGSWLGVALSDAQPVTGPVAEMGVGRGESVWGIAAAVAQPGQDVREVVDQILRLNGLASGDVAVGQQLLVPAG